MTPILRPYQEDMVSQIRDRFATTRRLLAVAPTGSGKTVTFAYITTHAMRKGKRVTIIAHRVEIVDQISRALTAMGVKHGRIQTGHRMTDDPVQVGMVITLAKRIGNIPIPDLLIIDEAHHSVSGSYVTIASAWPRTRILGVTATPQRLDGRGMGDQFDDLILGPQMSDLITAGFLAPYTYLAPPEMAQLDSVKKRAGDYAIDELAEAMDKAVITGDAISHYRDHLAGRPAIAFCVNIAHAEHVAAQFRSEGYLAASVDGTQDPDTRRTLIASIGDGRLNVLTSCQIISEGTDIPVVAGAILLRRTLSLSLYLQQVGRCLRPKADGSRAIILDHVGNVHRHGLPDIPREWTLQGKTKSSAGGGVSTCKQCFRAFQISPGWKAKADCHNGQPAECILNAPEIAPPREIEVTEGTLVQVATKPEWAKGMDIAASKGIELPKLIAMADTPDKLKQLAKARGYNHRWVFHILRSRHGRKVAA